MAVSGLYTRRRTRTATAFNVNSITGDTMIPVAVYLSKPDFDPPAQGKNGNGMKVKSSVKLPGGEAALTIPAMIKIGADAVTPTATTVPLT